MDTDQSGHDELDMALALADPMQRLPRGDDAPPSTGQQFATGIRGQAVQV